MASVSLSAGDVIIIDGRRLTDLADQDLGALEFPNDIATVKVGKGGNSIFADNAQGKLANFTIRIMRGSSDAKYLNSRLASWFQDPALFTLLTGTFIKRVGDGQQNVNLDVYQLINGVFTRQVDAKTSAEGDADQAVAVYRMTFANVQQSIQ